MRAIRVPDFSEQVMAVSRVESLLRIVSQSLDQADVAYAVIGGNAVAAWARTIDEGAVRATKEVDVLLRRDDIDAAASALRSADLVPHEIHGVSMFLDLQKPNPETGVHVVFANEKVLASSRYPAPDVTGAVRTKTGFSVIDLPSLLFMKLVAFRRIDQVHVEDLLATGLIDENIIAGLPNDLRERLQQIQSTRK
jgi:hypothetical protein